jgi:hypothetical protein
MNATPLNISITPDLSVIRWFGRNQAPTIFTITNNDERIIGTCELYCVRGDFLPKGAGKNEKAFLKKSIGEDLITQGWLEARLIGDATWTALTDSVPLNIGGLEPEESKEFEIRLVVPNTVTNEGKTNFAIMVAASEYVEPIPAPAANMVAWYDAAATASYTYTPSMRVQNLHCAWSESCTPSSLARDHKELVGSGIITDHSYGGSSWDVFRYYIRSGIGLIKVRGYAQGVWYETEWGTDVTLKLYRGSIVQLHYAVDPASGGYIAEWQDLVAGQHLTQSTQDYKPRLDNNIRNGLPAVVLDGSDDFMTVANTMLRGNGQYTIVAVWEPENIGSIPHLFYSGALSSNGGLWLQESGGSWLHGWFGNDQTVPGATGGIKLHAIGWDGFTRYMRINGSQIQAAATGRNTVAGNFNLGRSMASNGWMRGKIYEMVIYDRWLSLADIATTETYLTDKWGL